MIEPISSDSTAAIFRLFTSMRRIVYSAFDMQTQKTTRTQQIILMTLADSGTLSMSELARKVNTSNEQATRAVAQLVGIGFINRIQNENNRRIINISLTKAADKYLNGVYRSAAELIKTALERDEKAAQKAAAINSLSQMLSEDRK